MKLQKYLMRIIGFAIFVIYLFPAFAIAEKVTPSDRVKTFVVIHKSPSVSSDNLGELRPNESAELLDSVPYWHHVELANGIKGYVSKAWTVIAQASANSSGSGKTDLIVGSWNIKWFGNSTTDKHDYEKMAEIIERFDVAAIQELRGSNYLDRLNKLIAKLSEHGFNYTYCVSDETGYLGNPEENNTTAPKKNYLERYAFVWDTDRVHPIYQTVQYEFVSTPKINNNTFRQVPIYSDFKVNDGNGFDFRILTIHTVYNDKINSVRRAEIQFLNDWIIDQSENSSNIEKDVIVIGDFNANPSGQPHHFDNIISGTNKYRVLMNEPLRAGESSIRTTIPLKDSTDPDYLRLPVYDHILVTNQTSSALFHNPMTRASNDLGVVEFDREAYWNQYTPNEKIQMMSDHRPIWFRLDYNAQDLD